MEKAKNILDKYKFEIVTIFLFSIAYIIFCNFLMIELPHMTWFDQFPLITKYYEGNLTVSSLFTTYGEHGLLGNNILFLMNVILFKMTTFFDVYLNDINVILVGTLSVFLIRRIHGRSNGIMYKLCIVLNCVFAFSTMQLSSGAMETQVRLGILFFVTAAIMVDKVLKDQVSKKYLICTIIMIIISINIFGTIYSFSGIPVIFLIIIMLMIKNKKVLKKYVVIALAYIISVVLYFLQYRLIGKGSMESHGILYAIKCIIYNPIDTIKGLLAYNASTLLGYATYADNILSGNIYICIGLIVTVIYVYAIVRFIKSKMYNKTYLPVMFIGYSILVLCLTMVGRYTTDWGWYVAYWYTVHTKLAAIGTIWILLYDFSEGNKNIKSISIACAVFLAVGSLFGNMVELKRVPYERAYYLEKQPYLFAENIDELPVDKNGQTPLLHTPQVTIDGIATMKKYNLSVYRYYDSYNKMARMQKRNIGSTLATSNIVSGIYDDKWIEKKCELNIKTGNEGKVIISGYYPNEITGEEKGIVEVDNVETTTFEIKENNFKIETDTPKDKIVNIKINNGFDFSATLPDERRLSFILSDVQGK